MTVPQEVKLARHAGDLDDDGHDTYGTGLTGFLTKIEGGQDTIKAHGAMGATETFDPTDGNVHTGTLTADCTVTLSPPAASGGATLIAWFTQSGGPWTLAFAASGGGSFAWDGTTPTIPATGTFRIVLERTPGTSNDWVGIMVGGGGVDLSAIDFLVGTASGLLSGEIVAGTTPGGELGGTWGSPTVDATHSGSTHAATQAAAEATAAAALAAHVASTGSGGGDHVHVVDEQFSGDASAVDFNLANSAIPDSVMAYVSGTRTPVTLGGTLNDVITFGSAPASASLNISVDYAAVLE